MIGLAIVGGGFLLLLIIVIGMYNSLVGLRNQCDESWSDVETELQRRYNLIPNLVNTVKGYAQHERQLLEEVTRLRQVCADNNGSPERQSQTESQLHSALGALMVRLEAYPELKADQNFLALQQELTNTEDRIQAAYRFYNGNVRDQNNRVQMFPSSILASMFGFTNKEFFRLADDGARNTPNVQLP